MIPSTLVAAALTYAWPFAKSKGDFIAIGIIYGYFNHCSFFIDSFDWLSTSESRRVFMFHSWQPLWWWWVILTTSAWGSVCQWRCLLSELLLDLQYPVPSTRRLVVSKLSDTTQVCFHWITEARPFELTEKPTRFDGYCLCYYDGYCATAISSPTMG